MININKIALLAKLKGKRIACYTCKHRKANCIALATSMTTIVWGANNSKQIIGSMDSLACNYLVEELCKECSYNGYNYSCFDVCESWEEK